MMYGDGSKLMAQEISGRIFSSPKFLPWQPSSWPDPGSDFELFSADLETIFEETILTEIENVISDARIVNGGLEHRGHVVALSLFCAIDTLSSYAYAGNESERCGTCGRGDHVGPRYKRYIEEFFPDSYKPYAQNLYSSYRNSLVHSWNLFKVAISPGNEVPEIRNEVLVFGLLNFFDALVASLKNFIIQLGTDKDMQKYCIARYEFLRAQAKSI